MAKTTLVAYSQRLQETVGRVMGPNSLSVNQPKRERGHNSLKDKNVGGGGSAEYNGMFKLSIVGDRVAITSNAGFVIVNGVYRSMPDGNVPLIEVTNISIRATIATDGRATLTYGYWSNAQGDETHGYYALGCIRRLDGGKTELIQYYHANPIINTYGECKDE